jgi:lysophospholipase
MSEFDRRAHPVGMRLWTWIGPDGWQHRRMDWGQPRDAPVRGSLLFVPGRGDFIEKYLEPIGHWHRGGWNVASFDWRGQGKSTGDIVGQHHDSFDPLLADFAALVADWQAASLGPHVIVGHSMGGHFLLRLLIELRLQLAAAVLVAPMIDVNSRPFGPHLARLVAGSATGLGFARKPLWKAPLQAAGVGSRRQQILTGSVDRYADEAYWWEQDPDFVPSAPTFGWLRAAFRSARCFTAANLRRINLPILILAAEEDRLVSGDAIRRAARLLPSARLVMYDRCAHELLREEDETRLAVHREIDAFLDRQAP